jgi:hypothetical protein
MIFGMKWENIWFFEKAQGKPLREIGDALYICSFFKKGFVIVILYAKTITN